MEERKRKSFSVLWKLAFSILAAPMLRLIGFHVTGLLHWFCCILRPVIYIGLFILWGGELRRRIIQP